MRGPAAYKAALCRAINDWLAQEWLDRDPRLRGSLNVPFDSPDLAVAEIERFADDRRFVQVMGNRYRGSGAPSYYLEQHVWLHMPVERLAMSMIREGVFDAYPRLQVALVEACLTWSGSDLHGGQAGLRARGAAAAGGPAEPLVRS